MSPDAPNVSPSSPTFYQCSAAELPKLTDVQSRGSVMNVADVVILTVVTRGYEFVSE